MSGVGTSPQLAVRQDIHKSCRTLETLLNILSDYCEAAGAIATLQRKLSKALKEAAALKTTSEIAANALSVSASIFDVLSDVDAKFAKISDKECAGVVSDMKKWLKKLAKEERAHDERMNDSNARIKQAGQVYEKKAKKSAHDASEEHARYVNLLSVLGPEMSQEKYNHALSVMQHHTSTTYSVAACLSRVADAEWVRTCESIRRFSPSIGPLGEWRALCEGSWTGPLPDDLPDAPPPPPPTEVPLQNWGVTEWGQTIPSGTQQYSTSLPFPLKTTTTDLERPHPAFSFDEQNQGSVSSITTLSAFPIPPTHFPVPLVTNEADPQRQRNQVQSLQVASSSQTAQPQRTHLLSESPQLIKSTLSDTPTLIDSKSPSTSQGPNEPLSSQYTYASKPPEERVPHPRAGLVLSTSNENKISEQSHEEGKPHRLSLITRATSNEQSSPSKLPSNNHPKKPPPDREFGASADTRSAFKSRTIDVAKRSLERTDSSMSNGSIVAVMRSRYSRTIEPSSQAPKDVPRLPMSVSDLASRYQPIDEPMTPRRNDGSPIMDRHAVNQDPFANQPTRGASTSICEENFRWRTQRIEELAELEFKQKEFELRQRERELNQNTHDFERNRMQFLDVRGDPVSTSEMPKGPPSTLFHHTYGSQSTSHLIPSSSSAPTMTSSQPGGSLSPSRSQPPSPLPAKDHAPFCGCYTCSITKYKVPDVAPSAHDLPPSLPPSELPIQLRPEKPKGWIRRLSMPAVGAAFLLDTKKNASATSLKSGLASPAENRRQRKGSFEQGIGNRSVGMVRR